MTPMPGNGIVPRVIGLIGVGRFEVERFRLAKPVCLYSPGDRFASDGIHGAGSLGFSAAGESEQSRDAPSEAANLARIIHEKWSGV
jgi:hypothetical protein